MTLWAKYLKERLGVDSFESELGFLTYQRQADGSLLICDFYVDSNHRGKGEGQRLIDAAISKARELGLKEVTGNIWPGAAGASEAVAMALSHGFKLKPTTLGCVCISIEV